MDELKKKIAEYDRLLDLLVERALNSDIEKDSVEWSKLGDIKNEITLLL
jgi:hypothetical protein